MPVFCLLYTKYVYSNQGFDSGGWDAGGSICLDELMSVGRDGPIRICVHSTYGRTYRVQSTYIFTYMKWTGQKRT